ncbi:MAG: S8 family peptidase [Eubacteriaceae bacterium]|nr:S8 family peptidase [Eubacteriaceae bacterium]
MHDDGFGNPVYAEDKRPEQVVKEAIEFFNKEYHCRVFNLSSGDLDYIYAGGRQMTWAGMIDEVARELDVVIIVSAGNQYPELPEFSDRDDICEKDRNQLLNPEHRLIDPATSALAVTAGSITRTATPDIRTGITAIPVGQADSMSVFTRTGKGVNNAIKPEFVDYGGNYSVQQVTRGNNLWRTNDRLLMEPSTNHTTERVFKGWIGTSFAAPHVTHFAARLERSLEAQLEEAPSSNLMRAMLASAAFIPYSLRTWAEEAVDASYAGARAQKADNRLRLIGYGKIDEEVLFSDSTDPRHVTLFAEGELALRSFHLYKIPVPTEFIGVKGNKRISIGFSYNPPIRMSRKEYIGNSLFIEVFRRTDLDNLLNFAQKKEQGSEDDADAALEKFRQTYGADFEPGSTTIQNSTLQQRFWSKGKTGGKDLLWPDNDPYTYVLVTGKERFTHAEKKQLSLMP